MSMDFDLLNTYSEEGLKILNESDIESLNDWEESFFKKYECVGKL